MRLWAAFSTVCFRRGSPCLAVCLNYARRHPQHSMPPSPESLCGARPVILCCHALSSPDASMYLIRLALDPVAAPLIPDHHLSRRPESCALNRSPRCFVATVFLVRQHAPRRNSSSGPFVGHARPSRQSRSSRGGVASSERDADTHTRTHSSGASLAVQRTSNLGEIVNSLPGSRSSSTTRCGPPSALSPPTRPFREKEAKHSKRMASSSNSSRPPAQMRPSGSSGNVRGRTAPLTAQGPTQARNSGNAGNAAAGTTVAEARFRKSVEIIQSLPKSGPISTTYEEKLMLYSLYKQGA